MGLGNKAPSALNLEFPGAGHVTRFAAPAECVVDFELRSQQGGVSRKRHAFFAWKARRAAARLGCRTAIMICLGHGTF